MAFGDIIKHIKQASTPAAAVRSVHRPRPGSNPRPVRRPGGG